MATETDRLIARVLIARPDADLETIRRLVAATRYTPDPDLRARLLRPKARKFALGR